MVGGSGPITSDEIATLKEHIRWAADLSMRLCPHHQWPGPRPSAEAGCFDAGFLRDHEELQLLAEVVLRADRGATHGELEQWVRRVQGEEPPAPAPLPDPIGLPHGYRKPRGAYLYGPFWLFACQFNRLLDQEIDRYLLSREQRESTHVVVTLSTGHRPPLGEQPYNAIGSQATIDRMRTKLTRIIKAGKSPWIYLCSQEYYTQQLQTVDRLIPFLEQSCEAFADLATHITPFREVGDCFDGQHLEERSAIFRAVRKRSNPRTTSVCVHERAGEGVPLSDVEGLENTCSAMQAPFDWSLHGQAEAGGHTYAGVLGFWQVHHDRFRRYQEQGRLGEHSVGIFECSIPPDKGFTDKPRTFDQARSFGEALLRAAGPECWELSGGAGR